VSTSLFMCKSKGRRLVINSSYHISILFIIGPLFFTTLHIHLGLPHPIIAHLSRCQCGHTIDDLGTHLIQCPYGNERLVAHDTVRNIIATIVLESKAHVQREVSHLFPHHTRWQSIFLLPKTTSILWWTLSLLTQLAQIWCNEQRWEQHMQ
jgi:hypothetical protein